VQDETVGEGRTFRYSAGGLVSRSVDAPLHPAGVDAASVLRFGCNPGIADSSPPMRSPLFLCRDLILREERHSKISISGLNI
jgi:hypothetical protein